MYLKIPPFYIFLITNKVGWHHLKEYYKDSKRKIEMKTPHKQLKDCTKLC